MAKKIRLNSSQVDTLQANKAAFWLDYKRAHKLVRMAAWRASLW